MEKKNKREIFKNIFFAVVIIIILPFFIVNLIFLIKSYMYPDQIPDFLGYKPFIVLSGSMQNEIEIGDLAIVKEVDSKDIKVNDIIAYKIEDLVITHRVLKIDKDEQGITEFITKGDKNTEIDDVDVYENMIEGKYIFKLTGVGNIAMSLQKPTGLLIATLIPISLLIIAQISRNIQYKKEIEKLKKS